MTVSALRPTRCSSPPAPSDRDVAGAEPAVGVRAAGAVRPVAGEQVGAAQEDPARVAVLDRVARRRHAARPRRPATGGRPNRARPVPLRAERVHRDDRRRLGQPVAVVQHDAGGRPVGRPARARAWWSPDIAKRTAAKPASRCGCGEPGGELSGHAEHGGDPFRGHRRQRRRRVEPVGEHERRADAQRHAQAGVQAEDVAHRQRDVEHVVGQSTAAGRRRRAGRRWPAAPGPTASCPCPARSCRWCRAATASSSPVRSRAGSVGSGATGLEQGARRRRRRAAAPPRSRRRCARPRARRRTG